MSRNTGRSKSGNARRIVEHRVGVGYDVHQFAPKRKLMLGGVRVPHLVGLAAHSDGDVLLHAICDALLGAAGLGDIGQHFPDTQKKFEGISSLLLLRHVRNLLRAHGFEIENLDSTVILQRPRIGPYVPRMRKTIAKTLLMPPSKVSVKATTNEGIGFIGRGEGCAALAVASVRREVDA